MTSLREAVWFSVAEKTPARSHRAGVAFEFVGDGRGGLDGEKLGVLLRWYRPRALVTEGLEPSLRSQLFESLNATEPPA